MKVTRILCPIDYSFYSKAANYYASLFADSMGSEIIYLNVLFPPRIDGPIEDQLKKLHAQLSLKVRPFVHGVKHVHEVRDGDPAKEILRLAEERNVDLIVMGTHGTTGLARLLHGSVCAEVLRKSTCPVMAVKDALNMNWVMQEPKISIATD